MPSLLPVHRINVSPDADLHDSIIAAAQLRVVSQQPVRACVLFSRPQSNSARSIVHIPSHPQFHQVAERCCADCTQRWGETGCNMFSAHSFIRGRRGECPFS
ncbi:hypothetical protein OBBRIDRAFT_30306 [Obba rivulosa]|uniref:Uncharacterized protein n=1 Tax=Obba rivulosa TaxID=1052685 RepID=A0A8E2AQX6_9APHY|nr:hypothetical protein OBBRIDRAFT_30306 [Obba rivulosa]